MYLDPGSTSLLVQALFALLATFVTFFGRTRHCIMGLWVRVTRSVNSNQRRPDV